LSIAGRLFLVMVLSKGIQPAGHRNMRDIVLFHGCPNVN
jgi:hypothetical protein